MSPSADILIVGAGILGVSTAFHLAGSGVGKIIVCERSCLSAGATGHSGALVRCGLEYSVEIALAKESMTFFGNWKEVVGGSCGLNRCGHINLGRADQRDEFDERFRRHLAWGVDTWRVDEQAMRSLLPELKVGADIGSITFEAGAGVCDPNLANRTLHDAARARGVEFRFDEAVEAFDIASGRCRSVTTSRGRFNVGTVVIAAGAWSMNLFRKMEVESRLSARISRVAVFRPYELEHDGYFPSVIDESTSSWFRPVSSDGILVGSNSGGMPVTNIDDVSRAVDDEVTTRYRQILSNRFNFHKDAACRGTWSGVYSVSPDGKPLIGALPMFTNVFTASGDSGSSFKIAPAIGRLLSDLITTGGTETDASMFSPSRLINTARTSKNAISDSDAKTTLAELNAFESS